MNLRPSLAHERDGGELADGVDHHVVHARGEAGVGEGYDAGGRQHHL